jgi:hypothetical protein
MARITELKRIYRYRTEEEMCNALQQFIDGKHELRIPPYEEDADMVLGDVINELLDARAKLCKIENGEIDNGSSSRYSNG